jgi:predicted nucleic acid-binding protein
MDCVADLSYTSGWFQPAQSHAESARLFKLHRSGEMNLIFPALWIYEILNLLAMAVRRGTLTALQADAGLELLKLLDVSVEELHSDTIRTRVHRFARQFKLTAYDAAYLELADRLQVPLLTRDEELIAAAKQRSLSVTFPK